MLSDCDVCQEFKSCTDVCDLMRHMVKEELLKFNGRPLFPERAAYTKPYKLSDREAALYKARDRLRARGVQPCRRAAERKRAGRPDGRADGHHGWLYAD